MRKFDIPDLILMAREDFDGRRREGIAIAGMVYQQGVWSV